MKKAEAYTDGSYNQALGIFGCGAVLIIENEVPQIFYETGRAAKSSNGWNINGEIRAAEMIIEKAILEGVTDITIYHDYEGVGKWPDHIWRTNKDYTFKYAAKINEYRRKININFSWVKGHSGNKYNEMADKAAKYGAKNIDTPPEELFTDHKNNVEEVVKPDLFTKTGRDNVRRFLSIKNPSYGDFINLKTGGNDSFSYIHQTDLEKIIGSSICEYIKNDINDQSSYVSALRWILRGLTPEEAVRKVNIDVEIKNRSKK